MNKSEYQSTIDSFVDDFRKDTVTRIETMQALVAVFQVHDDHAPAAFTGIIEEVHSVKGTAKTFGFNGLSYVTHALNDWMFDIAHENQAGIDLLDPALREDLQTFLSIMLEITTAKNRMPEQHGIDALAQTDFALYNQ
jgi:chemotaxis protein histidine kinase CheA